MSVQDSQGAALSWNGVALGTLIESSPSFAAGNVHEITDVGATVIGDGVNSRVIKRYNVTSIEPGALTARFIGDPAFDRSSIGGEGVLRFTWPGGNALTFRAAVVKCEATFARGEFIQWIAEFQATR